MTSVAQPPSTLPWRLLDGYRSAEGVYDESLTAPDILRPQFATFVQSLEAIGRPELAARWENAKRTLREGDVVSLDIGVKRNGWYGDAARTCPVGDIGPVGTKLLEVTERALAKGIEHVRPGARLSDISAAIERESRRNGFSVVRALVGHGIGRELHEEPQVPNYGQPGEGPRLRTGMVFAIEPMVNAGGSDVITLADQWTVVTADRKLSAHFEHTVAVGADGPDVLSRVEAD